MSTHEDISHNRITFQSISGHRGRAVEASVALLSGQVVQALRFVQKHRCASRSVSMPVEAAEFESTGNRWG